MQFEYSFSNDPIQFPRNKEARESKHQQPASNAPKPRQTVRNIVPGLAWHVDVHAPHTSDDIHGKHNRANNSEFAEDVGVHFRALVHADVDLGDVVAVGSAEEAVSTLASCFDGGG
jgi:hypothetical protein